MRRIVSVRSVSQSTSPQGIKTSHVNTAISHLAHHESKHPLAYDSPWITTSPRDQLFLSLLFLIFSRKKRHSIFVSDSPCVVLRSRQSNTIKCSYFESEMCTERKGLEDESLDPQYRYRDILILLLLCGAIVRGPFSGLKTGISVARTIYSPLPRTICVFHLTNVDSAHCPMAYDPFRDAIPFHLDMRGLFGKHARAAEIELWIGATTLGAMFCKVIYDLMKEYSPLYFGDYYKKLPRVKQVEWDNRGFSTIHALFCGAASGYLLFISDIFNDDTPLGPVTFRSTILSYFTISFSTGYFLADLAMIVWTYPSLGGLEIVRFLKSINWPMVLHHFFSIGSVVLANYAAHAHVYILMVLFTEISTPFINIRWYLMTTGMKNSKLYLYNGVALLFVWLFARVILFIYFFYHIYLHYDQVAQLWGPGFYFMFTAPPGLALMNLFWFYKIVAGILKAFSRTKTE